ncbi:hypothetical protein [Sphingomonas bacterium]|uniref:hypothetical protein n=1 Tax=Sphingomonas bacterium TaxID=1895847 RepID=UPI001C2D7876|nr:hypothetical protein [Sphingomonas bacterium]
MTAAHPGTAQPRGIRRRLVTRIAATLVLGVPAAWAVLRLLPGKQVSGLAAPPPPAIDGPGFEALLAPLPAFAQDELRRRTAISEPPATAADLLRLVHSWLVGTGIAEGCGGYPGGRGKPGWTEYVEEQRRTVAVFRAVANAWGEPPARLAASVDEYDRDYPPPVRRMGDGWEPHVDDVAGRLVYGFPVQSSIVTVSFAYPITARDLEVLLSDPYRRAVMEMVTHTACQRLMIRGNAEVTEADFRALADVVLHAPADGLATFLAAFDREHNMSGDHFV